MKDGSQDPVSCPGSRCSEGCFQGCCPGPESRPRWDRSLLRAGRTRLGCSPRASARGNPLGRVRAARLGCSPRASARGNPLGRVRAARLGCSPRASARGNPLGRAQGLGCSPRASARGNPLGRVPGARLGCSPRASARGNPLGRVRAARLGCSPRASARGSPWGGCGRHGWDAALAQARGEIRWGGWRQLPEASGFRGRSPATEPCFFKRTRGWGAPPSGSGAAGEERRAASPAGTIGR